MSRDSIKNKLFNDKYKSVSQEMQDQLEPIFNDKEQPVQDESDGLLFFHSHSLWTVLQKVEEFYECKIYGVLDMDSLMNDLSYYPNFDKEWKDHIIDAFQIPKQDLLRAMKYAYDNTGGEYDGYQDHLDQVESFLVDLYTGGFADEE